MNEQEPHPATLSLSVNNGNSLNLPNLFPIRCKLFVLNTSVNILVSNSDKPEGETVGNKLIIPFFSIAVYSTGLGSLLLELSAATVFLYA